MLHISLIKNLLLGGCAILYLYYSSTSRKAWETSRENRLHESHLHISYAAVKHPFLQATIPPLTPSILRLHHPDVIVRDLMPTSRMQSSRWGYIVKIRR